MGPPWLASARQGLAVLLPDPGKPTTASHEFAHENIEIFNKIHFVL